MSVPYVPNKSNAVGPGYAAVAPTLNDPGASGYTAPVPTRWDAKFCAWPILNELLLVQQIQYMNGGAIQVYNATGGPLNNGPVRISGYFGDDPNTGNPIFKIVAADANTNTFANALLLTSLANTTQGIAYMGGNFTPSPALDTHLATIGDPVYLAAGGGMTLTAPSGADQMVQEIGRVKTLSATIAIVAGNVKPVQIIGTSFIQPNTLSAVTGIYKTVVVDLKTPATFTITIPTGGLIPQEFGVTLNALGGTITGQPTISYGITGTNAKYKVATATVDLSAAGKAEFYNDLLAKERETSITVTITIGATGSAAITAVFWVKGIPVP